MRLSVVVPAHDAADTIGAALASALAQTRPPDEIVVVDDGSSDATATAVTSMDRGVLLVRQVQQGPSAARNAGVAASSGDWIAFLDADDEWHPEKLAEQERWARDGVAIVATDWARARVAGAPPRPMPTTAITTSEILLLNRFQTSTVLLRRGAFEAAGGFDASLDGVEDWDMWLRASRHGSVVKLDWPFVRYTDVASGYSKKTDRVYRTGRKMLDRELGDRPGRDGRAILAWHHLRFATAYLLNGDRARAWSCIDDCRRTGLSSAVPRASVQHLAPFLAHRAARRLPARWLSARRGAPGPG